MTRSPYTPAEEIPKALAPTGVLGLTSAQLQAKLDEIHPIGSIDRTETEWFRTAVFYEVLVRSFKDSNGDGIDDFKGLTEKLDYLQWLGVDCLWLPPFYDSPLHDGGYDIRDYRWIREELGTIEDFKVFLDAAHDRGLRVIIDFVMNHTSGSHPWFQSSRADPDDPYSNYYVWSDTDDAYSDARIIFCDTEDSNWSWDSERKQFYWHRFFHHQPDLNFEEPRVMEEMLGAVRFWMNLGIDGFRLDAVPYLIEAEGTNCENLPKTHQILKQLRAMVDEEYPGRILLCEANQWPDDVVEYFGDGDECQMAFHFPVMPRLYMGLRRGSRECISKILADTPQIPEGCQCATFLRNHDELALEMVFKEDRQYMWEGYAPEPRWRCNLGIRRRLSPSSITTRNPGCLTPCCYLYPALRCCITATRLAWVTISGCLTVTVCAPQCSGMIRRRPVFPPPFPRTSIYLSSTLLVTIPSTSTSPARWTIRPLYWSGHVPCSVSVAVTLSLGLASSSISTGQTQL